MKYSEVKTALKKREYKRDVNYHKNCYFLL